VTNTPDAPDFDGSDYVPRFRGKTLIDLADRLADHEKRLRALEATQRSARPDCPYRDHPAHNADICVWCCPKGDR